MFLLRTLQKTMENLARRVFRFVQNNFTAVALAILVTVVFYFGLDNLENFSDADLKTGKKINLKTSSGQYVSICEGAKCGNCCINNVCLEDSNKGDASAFTLVVHNAKDKTISLKAVKGDYLFECEGCCKDKCKHIICADSTNANAKPGIFKLVENKGKYLLQTHGTQYVQLCTECDVKCKLLCAKPLKNLDADNLALEIVMV